MSTVLNKVCADGVTTKNTGSKKQCLEKATRVYFAVDKDFSFPDVATAESAAAWEAAIVAKSIVPFYDIDEDAALNNTDAVIKNARFKDIPVKDAIRGVDYIHYLDVCSYESISSFENSNKYTGIFRVTEANELLCVVNTDGTVTAEPITSFIVGVRNEPVGDTPASTTVSIKFDDYNVSILTPVIDLRKQEGIYDVLLTATEQLAGSIKFKAQIGCADDESLATVVQANINLLDAAGAPHVFTFGGYDANTEEYTLTGTGFATGFTLALKETTTGAVLKLGSILYESNILTLTV